MAIRIHCNSGFNSNIGIWDGVGISSSGHRIFDSPWFPSGWHEYQISQYAGNFILLMFRKADDSNLMNETEETIGADYEFIF